MPDTAYGAYGAGHGLWKELVGRNCMELVHPDDLGASLHALKTVVARPLRALNWEARVRHKNGYYAWVESTASNLPAEGGARAIFIHQRDIDTQRALELEQQKQLAELASSNLRLEEFAYHVAHDLREPLRTICLYTEMLVQDTPMNESSRQMASFIIGGAARMSTLIDNLLALADTGGHPTLGPVDLQRAMEDALRNLDSFIQESGAQLEIAPLPTVRGNEVQLVRLCQNLLSNAIKHRSDRPLKIRVTAELSGPEWIVRVSDNGCGIPTEELERIFCRSSGSRIRIPWARGSDWRRVRRSQTLSEEAFGRSRFLAKDRHSALRSASTRRNGPPQGGGGTGPPPGL